MAAIASEETRIIPESWTKTWNHFMTNIRDWCISRQLWWGHRIPAWYDDAGNIYVGRSEEEARRRHNLVPELALRQDEDVLDTWFSSALWPFSTQGWPDKTPELQTFYPSSVLVTGFDIIFFWVARMIMMGLKFADDVPFREIYIHGLIRDQDGQKMSKSKGNVIDPLDLIDGVDLETLLNKRTTGLMQPQLKPQIEAATRKQYPTGIPEFGTDALRFTFAAMATTGRDIRFDLNRVEGYRNFCNKIWNAARYVVMNQTEDAESTAPIDPANRNLSDRWIRSRFARTIADTRKHLESYRLDLAAKTLYEFTWNEYCDWYLELCKTVLQDSTASDASKAATRHTLVEVLEALLRCLHPLIPFITEEIWQKLGPREGATIMLQAYPGADEFDRDADAERQIEWIMGVIVGIRQIRGEMDISPGRRLAVLLQGASDTDKDLLASHLLYLKNLGRLETACTKLWHTMLH